MKCKAVFLIIILVLVAELQTRAQLDSIDYLQNRVVSYLDETPQEKLFVHVSKPHYLTGETLWFRIYHLSANDHLPFTFSKVAYIELVNTDNQSILQAKIKLSGNGGHGQIYLPTTMNSGKYRIIAYTRWMQNFDPSQFFSEEILIINPFRNLGQILDQDNPEYDLQFFPEGGNLINGIRSKVAFKGINKNGLGIDFQGILLDSDLDTVAIFSPNRFGIGSFDLVPDISKSYQAILVDSLGLQTNFPFPEVKESGYAMKVMSTGTGWTVSVMKGGSTTQDNSSHLYLTGLSGNEFLFMKTSSPGSNNRTFEVNENELKAGVNQITLSDSHGIPVCERKVFRYPENRMNINIQLNRKSYKKRELVEMSISTTGLSDALEPADISISVFQTSKDLHQKQISIDTYLWLLSDLKGQIENPDYYFENITDQVIIDMDNLMLSHGWSKYNLEMMLNEDGPKFKYLPEFINQSISAKITDRDTGDPMINQLVTVSVPDKFTQLYAAKSDEMGNLLFEAENIHGENELIFRYENMSQKAEIVMEPQFMQTGYDFKWPDLNVPENLADFLLSQSISMQVENIFIPSGKTEGIDSSNFYGIPDASYRLDDYTRFPVMEEVFREYVSGVNVRRQSGKFIFKVLDMTRNEIMPANPLVLLDGVPVFDPDEIMRIDPLKIEKIDVIQRHYYYGPLECKGIVAIFSYDSDLPDLPLDEGAIRLFYKGFQSLKSFYEPKYDNPEAVVSRIPDFRNQLFWDPEIHTVSEGKTHITFYTSDQAGTYRVQVYGLSGDGIPGSFTTTFDVVTD